MVNYAGFERSTPIRDLDAALLREMVDVQFIAGITVIRHAANAMSERGGGSIISVSSLTAHAPAVGLAAYAGSKAGLEYVTRIAAVEYGEHGVRVNCVAPHLIETPMTARIFRNRLAIEAVRLQTPLGRMGHVDDVANAALFLASDESGFITGQTLCVDGGASSQKLPSIHDYASLAQLRPDLLA
jgi:NAD(P)-dependent dehydrogenase (short-subunit alcohol dehydrogenase family)